MTDRPTDSNAPGGNPRQPDAIASVQHRSAASMWIGRSEWTLAAVLTILITLLHVLNFRSAGGLWRDEAAAVHLASMPTMVEVWKNLEHESFPLLITLLLRAWSVFSVDDLWLRALGLIVGLAIVASLWWSSWRLSATPPLLSLVLFGLSPTVIRWGDSLRAYGLGIVMILLVFVSVWRALERPTWRRVSVASIAGILAVQTLYQNAYMLAAICLAGMIVTARRRNLRGALAMIGIGLPAAISLLIYRGVIERANEWNVATQVPIDLVRIWQVLHRVLTDRGSFMLWIWAALALGAVASGSVLIAQRRSSKSGESNFDAATFLLSAALATSLFYYAFLKLLKFPTEVWYYLVGFAVLAVATDALLARVSRREWARLVRIGIAILVTAVSFPATAKALRVRMTNLDAVAERLNEFAVAGDVIVVHPWFCGATLSRYYHGRAELTALPPLSDLRLQRLDLMKEQMRLDAPIQPVLTKMEAALRTGRTVWLVGYFPFANPPRPPPALPRAGEGPEGWRAAPYMTVYGMEVAYVLQLHARRMERVEVPLQAAVNPFENFPLAWVQGWR